MGVVVKPAQGQAIKKNGGPGTDVRRTDDARRVYRQSVTSRTHVNTRVRARALQPQQTIRPFELLYLQIYSLVPPSYTLLPPSLAIE